TPLSVSCFDLEIRSPGSDDVLDPRDGFRCPEQGFEAGASSADRLNSMRLPNVIRSVLYPFDNPSSPGREPSDPTRMDRPRAWPPASPKIPSDRSMLDLVNLPPDIPARPDGSRIGGWWHRQNDGRVVCDLCPRHCSLKDGDKGFCFVRENQGGHMVLTTYGK